MADSYQPIYDAVRSKISNGDVGSAVEAAIRSEGIGQYFERAMSEISSEMTRPSVMFKPTIFRDGNMWGALLGENLVEGVAGFGDTPNAAMWDFDRSWHTKVNK